VHASLFATFFWLCKFGRVSTFDLTQIEIPLPRQLSLLSAIPDIVDFVNHVCDVRTWWNLPPNLQFSARGRGLLILRQIT
jgi:hypothetical protein